MFSRRACEMFSRRACEMRFLWPLHISIITVVGTSSSPTMNILYINEYMHIMDD